MSRRTRSLPQTPVTADIESLTHEGRGVARIDGKAVFIHGALPGERVNFVYTARHRRHDEGRAVEVLSASPERVVPRCAHFGVCGGCALQHLDPATQLRAKQQVLLDDLRHLGKVEPQEILPPLTGPHWGYRRKARLGVKYVLKKERLLVGFRERSTPYLADLQRCEILHPSVGERLAELASLIASLHAFDRIAQIEVAVSDTATALVFRNLVELDGQDRDTLTSYGRTHGIHIHLQPAGPESVTLLWPEQAELHYGLPEYGLELTFGPTDFTQVNADINRAMVTRALTLLAPSSEDRVLDLFCGLGNFTLPLARQAREVVGVEGDAALIRRARDNAQRNGIGNVRFHVADLAGDCSREPWLQERFDKVLLDPPRTGAQELLPHLARLGARRLVYVSCNPATLARDAGLLVHEHRYRLVSAGVMDMFPHTAHVESIALFVK